MTFCANIVVCQPLSLTNGMISYSDPTLGLDTVATYTCDAGYYLRTGQSSRTCKKIGIRDANWNGSTGICLAIEGGSVTMELPSSPNQEDDTTISTSMELPSSSGQEDDTIITYTTESENITTVLAAVFGVLVALGAVIILITACLVVVHKKRSATHQHSHQSPSTKENECYSIRRLADPVYDEATFMQPDYSSINPAYHMTAVNDEMTHSYDYIKQPQSTTNTPQFTATNCTPVGKEAREIDFYDAEQHTYEVVNA